MRGPIKVPEVLCPKQAQHTKEPGNYVAWHEWAQEKSKTHVQIRCTGCGQYKVWVPRSEVGL